MKKFLLIGVLGVSLSSCSLLQRHLVDDETEAASEPETEMATDGPLFDSEGNELAAGQKPAASKSQAGAARADGEVSRLNTKIAALETKVEVLTATLERVQAQNSQPVIEAEVRPQPTMAAPVDVTDEIGKTHVSAAPARPAPQPAAARAMEAASPTASGAEKEFRGSMQLFQNAQYLEAASRFSLMAKKFPQHLLAGHALYWAGEANFRAHQSGLAGDSWTELEKRYPRSAYLPEALAGLAKIYDAQGDAARAKQYRSFLMRSFPKSPVALKLESENVSRPIAHMHRSSAPAPAPASEEDVAPNFEGTEESSEATGQ